MLFRSVDLSRSTVVIPQLKKTKTILRFNTKTGEILTVEVPDNDVHEKPCRPSSFENGTSQRGSSEPLISAAQQDQRLNLNEGLFGDSDDAEYKDMQHTLKLSEMRLSHIPNLH